MTIVLFGPLGVETALLFPPPSCLPLPVVITIPSPPRCSLFPCEQLLMAVVCGPQWSWSWVLSYGIAPHLCSPSFPSSPLSLHPPTTPRAVAREAGGGWFAIMTWRHWFGVVSLLSLVISRLQPKIETKKK
jgi:hypothetical protein